MLLTVVSPECSSPFTIVYPAITHVRALYNVYYTVVPITPFNFPRWDGMSPPPPY